MKTVVEHISIIGLGHIGGSLGLALKSTGLVRKITGYDIDARTRRRAKHIGAIDTTTAMLEKAISAADLVILAAPIHAIVEMIPVFCERLRDDACALDVAGLKTPIFTELDRCHHRINYIGGHPMAGREFHGIDSADAALFDRASFILTPYSGVKRHWIEITKGLVTAIGMTPSIIQPELHDRLIAVTSHLPHAIALALVEIYGDTAGENSEAAGLIAGSFRDATRVGASDPQLVIDMLQGEREHTIAAIDSYIEKLQAVRAAVKSKSDTKMRKIMASAYRIYKKTRL